ncbi:acetylglutamate kinase [Fulvivirga lutimaris]|uniref:acetylglutamate kinase n=1 Tax=Fulvivirga lutimaris TaxID=1819566 RepID=UPI0012BD4E63|nr:acetylglutamate kinase [Fulvivirga lutimaris]MTI41683.1 acetylglutamate kinase [Fulvivirga lutimaris]
MAVDLKVIKIGGNVIDNPAMLDSFLQDFAALEGSKILVHGGGKKATELSQKMGFSPQMVEGRRITTDQDIEVVTMVYAGLINKCVVAKLQKLGNNTIGLSGADGNAILASKRPVKNIDYGWVGDIEKVNAGFLRSLIDQGITPVLCAITHDGNEHLLNTNADTIASEVAVAMSTLYNTQLIYCFEKQGVLTDVNDESSVISELNEANYNSLKDEEAIHSGMIPKLDNCFNALKKNVAKVIIGSPEVLKKDYETFTTLTL